MIAVAVAMSVIIFMWSQGFLSQTSSSTGGQQGAQNQAAQSSISIEQANFQASTTKFTVVVRNVGAVAVSLGSITVAGITSNAGFTGSLITTVGAGTTFFASPTASDGSMWMIPGQSSAANIAKGSSVTITFQGGGTTSTAMKSGDVMSIKITTSVGTFAQSQYTVP